MRARAWTVGAAVAGACASAALAAGHGTPAASGVLAFARGGDIYTVDLATRRVRALVATRAYEHSPAFAPGGERLLFVREEGGNADIYVVSAAAGAAATRLTRTRGGDYNPAWSPDGRRVAFASNRGGPFRIYTMAADGTGVRLLGPRRSGGGSYTPAWSPDGRLIAFSSSALTPENPEIYAVRPDGTGLQRLTRTRGDLHTLGDDAWPGWAPRKRIVFSSNRTGDGEIWIMRADGGEQERLAGLPGRDDLAPAVSPDGSWVAFHSLDALGNAQLYLVRPGGGGLTKLGIAGEGAAWRP